MILPFSSICTQIPIILMALVYLVFFGVSALNKNSEKSVADTDHTREIIQESKILTTPEAINYLKLVSCDQHEAISVESTLPPLWRISKNTGFINTRSSIPHDFFSYFTFCRPPPVLA